jgi:hypothetical protein
VPTAVQPDDQHETPLNSYGSPGGEPNWSGITGVDWAVHFDPAQCMASVVPVLVSSSPTALQLDAAWQATLARVPSGAPVVDWFVQVVPFQNSASGNSKLLPCVPTASQLDADAHLTR